MKSLEGPLNLESRCGFGGHPNQPESVQLFLPGLLLMMVLEAINSGGKGG